MSRPIQGGDGERCGLRSAKWTSTFGPSTVQLYVADSARRLRAVVPGLVRGWALGGGDIRLIPTEWQLLEILVRNRGRLVTQRQLLQEVWGPTYETESNYLRAYLAQLRRKLEPEPSRPRYLLTERAWATASRTDRAGKGTGTAAPGKYGCPRRHPRGPSHDSRGPGGHRAPSGHGRRRHGGRRRGDRAILG